MFSGSYDTASFAIGSDGHGGTDITFTGNAVVPPDFAVAAGSETVRATAPEAGGMHVEPILHDIPAMTILHHFGM